MPDREEIADRFLTDASGRLTFESARINESDFPAVCREAAAALGLTPRGTLVLGPGQMFLDFGRGSQSVGFDWDVWSGFMVVAKTEQSESLVREIADWLQSK